MSEVPALKQVGATQKLPTAPGQSTLTGNTNSHPFFKYYAQLTHQQNMLQDLVRTGTYHEAVQCNRSDFAGKRVIDVGTGSGILALFAARNDAEKVFAIEASDCAQFAEHLILNNGFEEKISVVNKKVEEVQEVTIGKVDMIISEPMGFMLLHERMLESFMYARDKFLKPEGKMFPTTGTMYFLPFSDAALVQEQEQKACFWNNNNFFGVDINCMKESYVQEVCSQAIVGTVDSKCAISNMQSPAQYTIDFKNDQIDSLKVITVPFEFEITATSVMNGLIGWFDVDFVGSSRTVTLSTSPTAPTTHWYQCRFLLKNAVAVNRGQRIHGKILFTANDEFSYDVELEVALEGTEPAIRSSNKIKLQDQQYSYLYHAILPSEDYSGTGATASGFNI